MKPRNRHYRDWMEWRDPRRFGAEDSLALTHELSRHQSRQLGPLLTFEDAARVRAEGEASFEAAMARHRERMAMVRRKLERRRR
jgi:hypothetical protein